MDLYRLVHNQFVLDPNLRNLMVQDKEFVTYDFTLKCLPVTRGNFPEVTADPAIPARWQPTLCPIKWNELRGVPLSIKKSMKALQ